jgi:voltage-gated potassium channel
MNSIFFVVLRRMRAPLIALIVMYAIAILGLTIVPGINGDGTPAPPMSFFHAFYFISYTATTIGFGEIPTAFSDAQRLWAMVCIYMTVVAWTYTILTLLALLQDKAFQHTLVASRFARRVTHLNAPFFLVCGCGETGYLICRALNTLGYDFVILEKDPQRVEELDLEDFRTNDPALAADARQTTNLLMAGLRHPQCQGVLAVTNDEESNLAISINARLLNSSIPVLARARSPDVEANMASFGTQHIINASERFAEYLALAVSAPEQFRLIELLDSLPGTTLPEIHRPPRGRWIICGYGQFGQLIARHLRLPGIELTIIDPEADGPEGSQTIAGIGTEVSVLEEAGIRQAVGIVAGSPNDISNLSIAMMAKKLNPTIFVVARQNQSASDVLFDCFHADFVMVHTRIVAQECISIITTPLLSRFLNAIRSADEHWCRQLATRLENTCNGAVPDIWDIQITPKNSPAAYDALSRNRALKVGQLLRDNADVEATFPVIVLMVERLGELFLLPDNDFLLRPDDAVLIAGQNFVRSALNLTLQNVNAMHYILTGEDRRGGWLWQYLFAKRENRLSKS